MDIKNINQITNEGVWIGIVEQGAEDKECKAWRTIGGIQERIRQRMELREKV